MRDRIAARAYEIWQYRQENGQHLICDHLGNLRERTAQDDWLEAEEEIRAEQRKKVAGNEWLK